MNDWLVADALTPQTQGVLAPLYQAASRGELALPICAACATTFELDQGRCDVCGAGDIAWPLVDPVGAVHSVTTVHRREPGLIVATQPYHVIDVELTSGHRLLMTTVTPAAHPPTIGDVAYIEFRSVGGVAVPAFSSSPPNPDPEVVT